MCSQHPAPARGPFLNQRPYLLEWYWWYLFWSFSLQCNECKADYTTSANLKIHLMFHHKSVKWFYCTICNLEIPSRIGLHKHDKDTHDTDVNKSQPTLVWNAYMYWKLQIIKYEFENCKLYNLLSQRYLLSPISLTSPRLHFLVTRLSTVSGSSLFRMAVTRRPAMQWRTLAQT